MLRGNVLAKIDGKGRLKVPASYRSYIETTWGTDFFVTSLRGESALIYPMEVYAAIEERMMRAFTFQPRVAKLRNALNYYGACASMDPQGRILIHPLLRDKAEIEGEVAVLGQQNFLQVWKRTSIQGEVDRKPLSAEDLEAVSPILGF